MDFMLQVVGVAGVRLQFCAVRPSLSVSDLVAFVLHRLRADGLLGAVAAFVSAQFRVIDPSGAVVFAACTADEGRRPIGEALAALTGADVRGKLAWVHFVDTPVTARCVVAFRDVGGKAASEAIDLTDPRLVIFTVGDTVQMLAERLGCRTSTLALRVDREELTHDMRMFPLVRDGMGVLEVTQTREVVVNFHMGSRCVAFEVPRGWTASMLSECLWRKGPEYRGEILLSPQGPHMDETATVGDLLQDKLGHASLFIVKPKAPPPPPPLNAEAATSTTIDATEEPITARITIYSAEGSKDAIEVTLPDREYSVMDLKEFLIQQVCRAQYDQLEVFHGPYELGDESTIADLAKPVPGGNSYVTLRCVIAPK